MEDEDKFKVKWRKSSPKDDANILAGEFANKYDISPYNSSELATVIIAGVRAGEIQLEKSGRGFILKNAEEWFNNRLMPNTIVLTEDDYKRALYRAFRILVLGDIAMTDFGSSRQRDFGQRWTDFTRGFLGEIGIEKFFKEKLNKEIDLEEVEIGDVSKFLPTDIVKVKENGKWRNIKNDTSIKTSKLGSMWLDIGTQLNHSEAFIFIKIGLTVDHLVHFFKKQKIVNMLVKIGESLGEIKNPEEELKKLLDSIEDIKPFPTYVPGFVWKKDLENGVLNIYETRTGNKKIIGGCGLFSGVPTRIFEGLGELTPPKHMACLDSLRWSKADWQKLSDKI